MDLAFESRLDAIEENLKQKISVKSAFADSEVLARELRKAFQFFDLNDSGTIDFDEFFAAMTQLNFIGVQRELEALFDRYDDDCSGTLDYGEFAFHLFGMGERRRLDNTARSVIERVKSRLNDVMGASGIHNIRQFMKSVDRDGSGTLDQSEFTQVLRNMDLCDLDARDIQVLMTFFDRDQSGRISVEELMHGLQGTMARNRKLLVREAFEHLDQGRDGQVDLQDLMAVYNLTGHPEVVGGHMSEEEAAQEFLDHLESAGGSEYDRRDGVVTWAEFLEYYKQVSAMIDDDHVFRDLILNSWFSGDSIRQRSTTGHQDGEEEEEYGEEDYERNERPDTVSVVVVHSNGEREVVSLPLEIGLDVTNKEEMRQRLTESGLFDVVDFLPHFDG
jgi:Ca2+-binding EF-hand superfamily protein